MVLMAFGVIWSEVVECDKGGLESDDIRLSPSLDRGDFVWALPEVVDVEVLLSQAASQRVRLRCQSCSQASRLISGRA